MEEEDLVPSMFADVTPASLTQGLSRLKQRIDDFYMPDEQGPLPETLAVTRAPAPERGGSARRRPRAGTQPLHPRIEEICRSAIARGRAGEAVEPAVKALIYYMREKTGRHDGEDAALMRHAFRGMEGSFTLRQLLGGAVVAGTHPDFLRLLRRDHDSAVEFIGLISMLARAVGRMVPPIP
jgi:hypothetical protein